ncbi:hypothetical protein BAE44_0021726 [Dichanthelium oligosanthes]|uniref:FAS1 domain-containing protein n=1 Tax=Dichanthelium oligosanthes TaxID=888268 RepID=A0A1E5UWK1_9POAL|nr:hypothetical protein BAE44_0021726 [Dichanthelium oligosanthes]
MNRAAARRRRRLSPLPPPRLLAVAIAFASTLLFLVLVLISTSPPSPPHRSVSGRRTTSGSSTALPHHCGAASLGELGDGMVSMLPEDLPFTVFVPSRDSFGRVLGLQRSNASAGAEGDNNTYAVLSRVLGFSAVPRRLLAADVPPRLPLDSVSGLRIHASRDERGELVVNGLRSECVDAVRGETMVHVIAGVLMDAEFERFFAMESDS